MKTLTEAVKECGGVWPEGAKPGMMIGWNGLQDTDVEPPHHIRLEASHDWDREIYRPEFEAHAAELSGKPGWGEAPEWAMSVAQYADGQWIWFSDSSPMDTDHGWADMTGEQSTIQHAGRGLVLGDWRNTLERRPVPAPEYDPADVAFKDGTPPVGWYGEVTYGVRACWRKCVMLPSGFAAVELDDRWVISKVDDWDFRELDHDRDEWVQSALKQDCPASEGMLSRMDFCAALYHALKSGELPVPE